MENETNQATYDEKVKQALRFLAEGKTRDEVSNIMGYNNYKSLDMYIRRRNFHWDSDKQTYVPNATKYENTNWGEMTVATSKVAQITALFQKEGADAKVIARRLGFQDHREMASYMTGKGYVWSQEKKNYVKQTGVVNEESSANEMIVEVKELSKTIDNGDNLDINQFIPLLIMLQKNQEKLVDILVPQTDAGTIPRYALPGVFVTKSVHMVNPLDMMIRDFARQKNISQRDIVATALIEFFKKYGYEREVEQMITSN